MVTVLFQVVPRKPMDRESVFREVQGINGRDAVLHTIAEDAGVAYRAMFRKTVGFDWTSQIWLETISLVRDADLHQRPIQ